MSLNADSAAGRHDLNVPPGGLALSTRARFCGPLVAQTFDRTIGSTGPKVPANEAVPRRSSLHVVVPDSACHRPRSRVRVLSLPSLEVPASRHFTLPN